MSRPDRGRKSSPQWPRGRTRGSRSPRLRACLHGRNSRRTRPCLRSAMRRPRPCPLPPCFPRWIWRRRPPHRKNPVRKGRLLWPPHWRVTPARLMTPHGAPLPHKRGMPFLRPRPRLHTGRVLRLLPRLPVTRRLHHLRYHRRCLLLPMGGLPFLLPHRLVMRFPHRPHPLAMHLLHRPRLPPHRGQVRLPHNHRKIYRVRRSTGCCQPCSRCRGWGKRLLPRRRTPHRRNRRKVRPADCFRHC